MFHRDPKATKPATGKLLKDLTRIITPATLLADEKRQVLLKTMRELTALETSRYDSLCTVLVEDLVHYCQSLPETANSYYSQAGGLVDHALNRTEAALSLFREFLVLNDGQSFSEDQMLWQYALYTAAILQGIGKLFVDYQIQLHDTHGQPLKLWNPLLEPLSGLGGYYDYEFTKEADVEFRRRLNLLLAKALMPASGFAWIAGNAQVLEVWLALLNEDTRSAGTLGAILDRADAMAIQRYFNEFLIRMAGRGGRYGHGGSFIAGTPASLAEKEQMIGIEFIQWLKEGLESGRILINKAPLFMVPGGMLMSQEMFQWFVREHPDYKNWMAVQKGFLALGLHQITAKGDMTSRFEAASSKEMHSGVVFSEFGVALPDSMKVHQAKTGKEVSLTAIEVTHLSHYPSQFSKVDAAAMEPLHKLTASGVWEVIEQEFFGHSPGAKGGV